MSPPRHLVALSAAAAGLTVAGVASARAVERRLARTRTEAARRPFGTLRSDPVPVAAEDGVPLHVEVDGPADAEGPTVVFVHGYALNLDSWHYQRAHLRGGVRSVYYDQRSHGRSGRSSTERSTVDQLGRDLATVLDRVAPTGPVVLVGHSMGGMTIMDLAQQRPDLFGDRVVGVALVSTTAGGLRTSRVLAPFLPERWVNRLSPRVVGTLAHNPRAVDGVRRLGADLGFAMTARLAFGDDAPADQVAFIERMLSQTPMDVLGDFFPNFDALDTYAGLESLARIPAWIVCGTEDRLTSVGHSRKMASRVPGSTLVECAGAGHMVILEQHEAVNAALDALLATVAGADAPDSGTTGAADVS